MPVRVHARIAMGMCLSTNRRPRIGSDERRHRSCRGLNFQIHTLAIRCRGYDSMVTAIINQLYRLNPLAIKF